MSTWKDTKERLLCGLLLTTLFSLATLAIFYDYSKREKAQATVEDVRVVYGTDYKNVGNDGHPIAGAVIGGYIGGLPGALAGASIGSDIGNQKNIVLSERMYGCQLNARITENGKLFQAYYPNLGFSVERECSVLRKGDTIFLNKLTRLIVGRGNITYFWNGSD